MQEAAEIIKDLEGVTAEMLEAAYRLPPEHLQDMHLVYGAGEPKTVQQRRLARWLKDSPEEFFAALRKEEKDFRDYLVKLGPARSTASAGGVEDMTDEGLERAIETAENWLKEHGNAV